MSEIIDYRGDADHRLTRIIDVAKIGMKDGDGRPMFGLTFSSTYTGAANKDGLRKMMDIYVNEEGARKIVQAINDAVSGRR